MSARRQIIAALSEDSLGGIATLHDVTHAEQLADAHRTEVLAETDARLEGERMQHGHRALFSDGIEHARQAVKQMAGEREEKAPAPAPTATPAPDGYLPGWLTSIGLAGSETERALYQAYEQAMAEVRQLRGEKATPTGTTATPGPTGRIGQLLDAIRTHRGEWTTKRVQDLYRLSPLSPPNALEGRLRHVARGDLRDLHAWGHLVLHEDTGRRFYTFATRKDGQS